MFRHAVVFLLVYVLGFQALNWLGPADNTTYAHPTYIDLLGYKVAAEKAQRGIEPFGFQDSAFVAVPDARVWAHLYMKPDEVVGGYLYPPLILHLAHFLPSNRFDAGLVFNLISLLALGSLIFLLVKESAGWPLRITVFLFLLTSMGRPFYSALSFGQVNVLVAVLMLWGYYFLAHPSARKRIWGQGLAGLLFWIKLVPVGFLALPLLLHPKRLIGIGAFVLLIGAAMWAYDPWVMERWVHYMLIASRQLDGLLSRWLYPSFGLNILVEGLFPDPGLRPTVILLARLMVMGLGAASLWLVAKKRVEGWPLLLGLPAACGIFLLSPVSWDHHLIYYTPPALLTVLVLARQYDGHPLLYILTGLVALWLVGPRFVINTHDVREVVAYRIDTLLSMGCLVWFILCVWILKPATAEASAATN